MTMTREQERKTAALEKALGNVITEAELRARIPGTSQNWFNHKARLREAAGVRVRDLWFYLPAPVDKALKVIEENRRVRLPTAKVQATKARTTKTPSAKTRGRRTRRARAESTDAVS